MARVKNGAVTKARHKKVLKAAKGYFGSKHRLYKTAKEQLMHSGQYAFRDRKQKKRDFRKMWIARINAACRANEISYSRFIEGLTKAGVEVNRKMLSEIAINDEKAFAELVKVAKDGKAGKITKAEVKVESTKVVKATAKEAKVEKEVKAEKKETAKKPAAKKTTTTKKETKTEEKVEKKTPAKKATATKTTAKKETTKKTTTKTTTAKKPAAKKTTK
jgi:large subunit ribosomal protein L20